MEERESRAITRLLHEARLPRMKTLEAFEFDRSGVSAGQLRTLAEGDYVTRAEPILLVGEAATGKTHLATGLCVAACRQRRRVRFTTATGLINELAEAAHANQLSRALARWERLDLICIDELGYVPLAETACELMFQVIADRAEKAAVIVTTNLPFSEWSQVIRNLIWQWMRLPGDVLFAAAAVLMAWDFLIKLRPLYPRLAARLPGAPMVVVNPKPRG